MTIKAGDKIPSANFKQLGASGMQDLTSNDIFAGKKVVLFAVPGAFTPTCSAKHLPGYIARLPEFKSKGIDTVACLAVNDPFVMKAWSDAYQAEGIMMLPDGNGTFTKALGLEMDGTGYGLGIRSQRFAMLIEDGVVKSVEVEKPGALDVSTADACMAKLAA